MITFTYVKIKKKYMWSRFKLHH